VYNGQWQNDYRTGNGICYFANGDVFQGLWKYDQMIRGLYRKANGEMYDGELKDGYFDGYGKYYWPNGKWFEGIFVQNKLSKGMLYTMDGKISEFKDGEQI
jgi:1-phosphatidylinositol-4-phosphate 5-kinase